MKISNILESTFCILYMRGQKICKLLYEQYFLNHPEIRVTNKALFYYNYYVPELFGSRFFRSEPSLNFSEDLRRFGVECIRVMWQ